MYLRYYKDWQWYVALLLAPMFWGLYSDAISPVQLNNVFQPFQGFMLAILIYPVVEEMVFRGLVQEYFSGKQVLQKHFVCLSLANIVTSGLFALSHLASQPVFWALLTFFPSLVFGYFKDRHGRLTPCVVLHSVYNFVFFIY